MKFRRNLSSRVFRNSDPDADSGGGGFVETPAPSTAATPEPVDTTAQPGAAADTGPKDMLEAMFGQKGAPATEAEQQEAAAAGKTVQQVRDERGRFAGKAPTEQQGRPDPTKQAQAPKTVDKPEHQMPEGLTAKAQERFQTLVNSNKELSAKVAEVQPIVEQAMGLQQTFRDNGIKREQFDQAMHVVGLMNRGDLRGALAALDEQRKLISLTLGESLPGADALADFPDLRQAVDNLQITEQHALEIARGRFNQGQQRQNAQRQQQETQRQQAQQDQQQQYQTAARDAQIAVDKFCQTMQKADLDFARIEPMLLEQIKGGLLQDVPPHRWPELVQKTYGLIKQTAGQVRGSSGATSMALRPTGGEAPTAQPKTQYEAMWGKPRPAGA
jgi:hypothetical protein